MDFDTKVKLAVYRHFADTGRAASPESLADGLGLHSSRILEAYGRLRAQRLLVFETDGATIRMAPPFSGVETQHVVQAGGIEYFANCAWDALGIPAALHKPAVVHSRCAQSAAPFRLEVGLTGPEASDWLFHSLLPVVKWWEDIVFT